MMYWSLKNIVDRVLFSEVKILFFKYFLCIPQIVKKMLLDEMTHQLMLDLPMRQV